MPTKTTSAELMEVGRKGGGKHWTKAQAEARKKALESAKRKTPVRLTAPDWLAGDALLIWKKIKKQAAGLDLLDNLDCDVLAVYCDAVARYRAEGQLLTRLDAGEKAWIDAGMNRSDLVKSIQSWARLISNYAEKLGFNPSSRARLVKKRADEILRDEFGEKFDG